MSIGFCLIELFSLITNVFAGRSRYYDVFAKLCLTIISSI